MKLALFFSYILSTAFLQAQTGYVVNDATGDFPVSKIINYSAPSSTFHQFKKKLVIVDFFGTWCVPCVKALPKLSALQEKYKNEMTILLVSEEPQAKLETFLKKQTNFIFPIVVDEEKNFVTRFQPPSYPYTVIVGKNGKVLAIPSLEEITEDYINKWLKEQEISSGPVTNKISKIDTPQITLINYNKKEEVEASQNKLVQLSQEFMYAAKTAAVTSTFIAELKNISLDEIRSTIKTDDDKKAFWINLYNAYTQVSLKKNPDQYSKRSQFFGSRQIEIAGSKFSLDDIEHGILRRSKIKWSLGYLNKLFAGKTEKQLRVNKLDYRLHFALNCGAKSCPPIAFYKTETIDHQLDIATKVYLRGDAEYEEASNTVKLPALMNWFRRDFGGKKKMIKLLRQLTIVPIDRSPKIRFKDYDWTLYLQNYKS